MSKTISAEQREAIESQGGVVLSAGAGAGKTFVIIEHLIELIKQYEVAHGAEGIEDYLNGIVVITFTKKATRELKKRIEDKLRKLSFESEYWGKVYEHRNNCFVGTIHSYCFLILKTVRSFDFSSFEIVEEGMIKQKIKAETLSCIEKESSILKNFKFKELQYSLEKIFFEAKLRLTWERDLGSIDKSELRKNFFQLFEIDTEVSYPSDKKLKWIEFLSEFQRIYKNSNMDQRFEQLITFFQNTKRLPTPSKKTVSLEVTEIFQCIKELKGATLEFSEAINDLSEDLAKKASELQGIFESVDQAYFLDGKISFSDIEFLMLRHADEIKIDISKLIVDEFQDVSDIQNEIFKNLVSGDYSKIFAVGDKKQAIYGFRGGEVSVFESLAGNVEKNLFMVDNYRSASAIVEFNNSLFAPEFPLEIPQNPQSPLEGGVEIYQATADVTSEMEVKDLETNALYSVISEKLNEGSEEIAVLYRFLTPAKDLIRKFIDSDTGFHCNFKVEKAEDPLQSILIHLLNVLVEKQSIENADYFISGYLKYLSIEFDDLALKIEDFIDSTGLLGLSISWGRFLSSLGLSYGHVQTTLSQIRQLERFFSGEPSKILYALNDSLDERIVIDVSNKFINSKVFLMTAHSSKGLEFNEVILANIMSNSRGRNDKIVLGESPLSFVYYKDGRRKLTPQFLLERREEILKKERESSRLFYVACTRAMKRLTFILCPEVIDKMTAKSWGTYLNQQISEIKNIEYKNIKIDPKMDKKPNSLFHDLNFQITRNSQLQTLGVMPEVSVAKLSLLETCPRKFYFKEVIGFSDEDFPSPVSEKKSSLKSSAERGSHIHKKISDFFVCNEPLEGNEFKYFKEVLKSYDSNYEFFSEKEIKFQVDGKMISGTPDLVVSNDEAIEIWDFKTGGQNEGKDEIYQVQIALYLYGWIQLFKGNQRKILSKIIYLDEEMTVERNYQSFEELENDVNSLIQSIYTYQRKIGKQCEACAYQKICLTEPLLSENQDS